MKRGRKDTISWISFLNNVLSVHINVSVLVLERLAGSLYMAVSADRADDVAVDRTGVNAAGENSIEHITKRLTAEGKMIRHGKDEGHYK